MFDYIKIERTMCYGTCPVYNVTVDKDGNVNYSGEMFVYKTGEYQWKISKKKVEQLNDLISDFGFSSFEYNPEDRFVTDQPSCITTVIYSDGKKKEIDHYYGHFLIDDRLTKFENKIERITGTKKYVNPKLYIYQVEEKASEPLIRYMVISATEKEAVHLVTKEYTIQEKIELKVDKIGVATNEYYAPTIVMRCR